MAIESSQTIGEPNVQDVGGHSSGAAVEEAIRKANAAATEVEQQASIMEGDARKAIAAETDPAAKAKGDMASTKAEGEMAKMGVGTAGQPIDLGRATDKDIADRANDIDADAKTMMKKPGAYKQTATATSVDLGAKGGGFKAVTQTALESISHKLAGETADGDAAASIKAKGGNLKGGNSYSAAQALGLKKSGPELAGPRVAIAPAGPGMGGGAAMMVRSQSVNSKTLHNKGAEARAERDRRDSGTPGNMSRNEYAGAKAREAAKDGHEQYQNNQAQQATRMASVPVAPMFTIGMELKPKGPSESILRDGGGENVG